MNSAKMGVLNDDGMPLNLRAVFVLYLTPNFMFVLLTCFNVYLIYVSKKHPGLNRILGKISNFFAKGALDRIIKNMLRHFEDNRRQPDGQIPMVHQKSNGSSKHSFKSNNAFKSEKKYDANYLILIPFQIELLLTVFIYKILSREVYPETCPTFLTTYANREEQVVCWLKNVNKNISNLSFNITLRQYCINQTTTYINFEHTDVICIQYVFKLINIVDTVTNIFAWHQAIVFIVTKSVMFSYWFQQKLCKTICWSNLFYRSRCIISFIMIVSVTFIYIVIFEFILPAHFILNGRNRIDLTYHLLYACSKFLVGIIVHVNLYTFYQWHLHNTPRNQLLPPNEEEKTIAYLKTADHNDAVFIEDYLANSSKKYLTPNVSA